MNRLIGLAAAGSCLTVFGCAPQDPPSGLVIADVTVISAEREAPLDHAYVRILDGRIAEVSEAPLRGEEEIDGAGRYLIAGLIDSHVHLAIAPGFPPAMNAEQAADNPDVVAAALAQEPRSYLFYGFTTVLDLIAEGGRIARWNALDVRPDAYFCGGAAMMGDTTQRIGVPYFSYDQTDRFGAPQLTPRAAVAAIADEGAICVKTFYDEGVPGLPTPTPEQGQALVTAAHEAGLPVFIHTNRKRTQAYAVAIGVDVIVHGMWRNPGEPAALDDEAHGILAAIAGDGIGYQPTTQVIAGLRDMLDDNYLARAELADAYPAALTGWYARELAGRYAEQARGAGFDVDALMSETIDRATEVTHILNEANANLVFGTDTASDAIYANPPGLNGRLEMDHWIAAGVSEDRLFRALTIGNARELGLDGEIGTVEAGKTANLLLLGANPLESVTAYDTIQTVFLHGEPIARETLSARSAPSAPPVVPD